MLSLVSISEMETMLAKERHFSRREDLLKEARNYCSSLDSRLDKVLSVYAKEGRYTDFNEGDMSVLTIASLRRCGFLEAVVLMDGYLKDPQTGLDRIIRR